MQSDCVVPPGDDWWFEPDPRLDSEGNRVEAGRGYYRCRDSKGCGLVKLRSETLEERFFELLTSVQPKPAYVKLFRAMALDGWKAQQTERREARRRLERRIAEIEDRLSTLTDALLFERRIDQATYESKRAELTQELALARLARSEAEADALDAETVLGFAEHVLLNAARLWQAGDAEQRVRLQAAIFPNGVRFDGERFGTPETSIAFRHLRAIERGEDALASVRCPNTGAKIRAARLAADLSQEELARAVGVSKESIRIMEKGEIVPSTAAFLELEDALGVAMPDLMDREEIRAQGRKTTARRSRSGKARARS